MPANQLITLDWGFWKTIIEILLSALGGAYIMFLAIRRNLRKDVESLRVAIKECEESHVYGDEFKQVSNQVNTIYDHLLNNPAHDKRSDDETNND